MDRPTFGPAQRLGHEALQCLEFLRIDIVTLILGVTVKEDRTAAEPKRQQSARPALPHACWHKLLYERLRALAQHS